MIGHCILSHGLHSSPNATKVSALAQVAESLGWSQERPDYSQIDTGDGVRDVEMRIERLLTQARQVRGPLVLAGSSMGALISGEASLAIPVAGLFLMAPPVRMPNHAHIMGAADVPTRVVHGWHDELIPAQAVVDWCAQRSLRLLLLDDNHRLEAHVDDIADEFARFLKALA